MHESRGAGEWLLQDRIPAWLRAGNSVYPRIAIAPGGTNKMTVRAIMEEKTVPRGLPETLNERES